MRRFSRSKSVVLDLGWVLKVVVWRNLNLLLYIVLSQILLLSPKVDFMPVYSLMRSKTT